MNTKLASQRKRIGYETQATALRVLTQLLWPQKLTTGISGRDASGRKLSAQRSSERWLRSLIWLSLPASDLACAAAAAAAAELEVLCAVLRKDSYSAQRLPGIPAHFPLKAQCLSEYFCPDCSCLQGGCLGTACIGTACKPTPECAGLQRHMCIASFMLGPLLGTYTFHVKYIMFKTASCFESLFALKVSKVLRKTTYGRVFTPGRLSCQHCSQR